MSVQRGFIEDVGLVTKDDISLPLIESEIVKFNLVVPKKIIAPVSKGEQIGELQVYIGNDLAYSASLIAMKEVRIKKYNDILYKILRFWMEWE